MKVKQLQEFLSAKCDPEAEIHLTTNGYIHVPLAFVQQGWQNPETRYVFSAEEEGATQFGLYLSGPSVSISGELEEWEVVLVDPNLIDVPVAKKE